MKKSLKAKKATLDSTTGILKVNHFNQTLSGKKHEIIAGFSGRAEKKFAKAVDEEGNKPFATITKQIHEWLAKYRGTKNNKENGKVLTKKQNSAGAFCNKYLKSFTDRSSSYLIRADKEVSAKAIYNVCVAHTNPDSKKLVATDENYQSFIADLEGLDEKYFEDIDLKQEFATFKEKATEFSETLDAKDQHKDDTEGMKEYYARGLARIVMAACDNADAMNITTPTTAEGNGVFNGLILGLSRQFFDLSRGAYKDDGTVDNPTDEEETK